MIYLLKYGKEYSRFEEKAAKYRLYKWIALALLVVFLLCGFVFFKNDITVENLRYLEVLHPQMVYLEHQL